MIGEPGDKVEFQNNQLYINDQPVDESYLKSVKTNDVPATIVPEGMIYVMGDNRMNSTDSMIIGPISIDKVVGRVKVLIWPISRMGQIE